jgi:predicted ATP-binding protein involved in virulence
LRNNIFDINDLSFHSKLELNPLIKLINENLKKDWFTETMDYIPPPFLVSRIQFKDDSYFQELSSGEKQKIYSLNSIIYHLKNIDSIHKNKSKNEENGIVVYDTINLIFDEIELYYHPEFQKNIIYELLIFIRKANYKFIKNINMLFLTHSPFILSDIPLQNILHLDINSKTGKTTQLNKRNQTFSANIHDLLGDNFFLNDTLIGKHADKKILGLINSIKKQKASREDIKLLNIIGDTFLKSSIKEFRKKNDKDRD